jgi:hypothetical protein
MKSTTKNALRIMTKHLGLKVKFVDYFPDNVHGKLLPREKRILINAHKPRYEHVFTVLHEIGHFMVHFKNSYQRRLPWYLNRHWQFDFVAEIVSKTRRLFRFLFARGKTKEWEADLWAFIAFFLVAKCVGSTSELRDFIEHHPEKFWTFLLAALAVTYGGIKTRIQKIPQTLLIPFRVLRKP